MTYIGKVEISNSWAKLEDLIKAKVEGQSSFAFSSDFTYEIQSEGNYGCRLCDVATTPSDSNEGFIIKETQTAFYKPSDGNYLYVKTNYGNSALVKVAVMGD